MKAVRSDRRWKTNRKLAQRIRLKNEIGLCGGIVYKKHREKIEESAGYMRTGNVSHYVQVKSTRKTRSRDRYGRVYTPAKKDAVKLDNMKTQIEEIQEDQ